MMQINDALRYMQLIVESSTGTKRQSKAMLYINRVIDSAQTAPTCKGYNFNGVRNQGIDTIVEKKERENFFRERQLIFRSID